MDLFFLSILSTDLSFLTPNQNMKRLTIAGAGAGKTYRLIEEVKAIQNDLRNDSYRYCAVITYTKAATDEIRLRLSHNCHLAPNIFVGTIHSFFTRFVLQPFAHLVREKDDQKVLRPLSTHDKSFIDEVQVPVSFANWCEKTFKDKTQRRIMLLARQAKIDRQLSEQGIVSYDKILQISKKVLKKAKTCDLVASRIKYLFIDEYQDTRPLIHELLELIHSRSKTSFFYIGDPTQCIFSFASLQKPIKGEAKVERFGEIPILKLKQDTQVNVGFLTENRRSTAEIVNFANYFAEKAGSVIQTSPNGPSGLGVTFLKQRKLSDQVDEFNSLVSRYEVDKESDKPYKLLLAYTNDHFDGVATSHGLARMEGRVSSSVSRLREFGASVLASGGLSKTTLFDCMDTPSEFDRQLEFRSFCFDTLNKLRVQKPEDPREFILKELVTKYPLARKKLVESYASIRMDKRLGAFLDTNGQNVADGYYSTIHKSKGLEATCVLVSARTKKELKKWLDYESADSSEDSYRLGYVAFTRARKFLSIACLEEPDNETLKRLETMNCKFEDD